MVVFFLLYLSNLQKMRTVIFLILDQIKNKNLNKFLTLMQAKKL